MGMLTNTLAQKEVVDTTKGEAVAELKRLVAEVEGSDGPDYDFRYELWGDIKREMLGRHDITRQQYLNWATPRYCARTKPLHARGTQVWVVTSRTGTLNVFQGVVVGQKFDGQPVDSDTEWSYTVRANNTVLMEGIDEQELTHGAAPTLHAKGGSLGVYKVRDTADDRSWVVVAESNAHALADLTLSPDSWVKVDYVAPIGAGLRVDLETLTPESLPGKGEKVTLPKIGRVA
jgi:hypothetical protein